ncbi:MAG: hypothetical protein GY948_15085 [Alphaproteobacteria bacterium]|nr:hypothetical protein [Alphaproteobacteria bacterium]
MKSTVNGVTAKVRSDLQQPDNGITLVRTDPDNPGNTGNDAPERPYRRLGEQIDAHTGTFVEGSNFAEDPLVRQGGIHGSGAQRFQLTPWQNDPEIDIKEAKFTGERDVPKLLSGTDLATYAQSNANVYEYPEFTKAQIDQLALTPQGTYSATKLAVAALAIEGLKQTRYVGDLLGLADKIGETSRLVAENKIAEAEVVLAGAFGELGGGTLGGFLGAVGVISLTTFLYPFTGPAALLSLAGASTVFAGFITGGIYGALFGETLGEKVVLKMQQLLNEGKPLALGDIVDIYNEIGSTATGTPVFREFTNSDNIEGFEVPSDAAEQLRALPGNGENSVFDLGDGNHLYVHGALTPGQSFSLLGEHASTVIADPSRSVAVGISDSGQRFNTTGRELLDAHYDYRDLFPKAEALQAITGLKLLDDFRTEAVREILDQVARATTFDPETNPAILIDNAYAQTLDRFGQGDEVFALSDGQIYRIPGGLLPGKHINLLEGERPGNPHIDPIVSFGVDVDGNRFEVDREGVNYAVEVVSNIGGDLEDADAAEALAKQAANLQDDLEVSLRDALVGDENDDYTVSGGQDDDTLEGDPGGDVLQGPRPPAPHVVHRQAVFSDADGDGVLDSVTRVTSFSNSTQVRKTFTVDPNGVPITEGRVVLHRLDQAVDGAAIGSIFGSQLGNALVGNNLFAQIGAGSVLSAVLGNFGDAIDLYFTDNGIDSIFELNQRLGSGQDLSLGESVESAFDSFGADVLKSIKSAGISAVSSFLAGELGEALGLDGGFEGQLFQAVTSRTIGTVANTVIDNAINISNGSSIDLFSNLNPSTLLEAGAGAVSTFVGGYLARQIVTAESQAGAIGGSIGGAIGSTIGFGLAGVGFFSGLGSTAIGSLVGGTLGSTVLGISLGAIILPGVGAFLGTILGTLLGDFFDDLFGGGGYPKATANIALDFESGLYYESGTNAANGGGAQLALVTSLAERSQSIINSYIELLGGENANSNSPNISFYQVGSGSSSQGLHINVNGSGGGNIHHTRLYPGQINGAAVDAGVEDAVLAAIKNIQTKGGDIYLKRAVLNTTAEDLRAFAGDLKIAEDYKAYLKDKAVIDALIAEEPNSAFAAGWLITLLRAEELGLATWQESDFYGGLEGLLLSLQVEAKYGAAIQDVDVSVVAQTLADGTTRKDLVLKASDAEDAEVIARINGFEAAAGFTVIEGTAATGTAGKDIWFAHKNGASFTDGAVWSDENSHDILIGNAGNDTINGGMGWDFIAGGHGNDALNGGAHEDTVFGQGGDDILIGDDTSYSGGPWIESGTDPDSTVGADANDGSTREWFGFRAPPREAVGHYNTIPERTPHGRDTLDGGDGSDIIIGVGGSDRLFGGAGNDWIYGGEDGTIVDVNQTLYDGDDLIEGGEGSDHIDGGEGFDTASYAGSARGVTVSLQHTGPQISLGDAGGDLLLSIEDLVGSAFGDQLTGDAGANVIDGGAGDDQIDGDGGLDTVSYFSFDQGVTVMLALGSDQAGRGFAKILGEDVEGNLVVVEEDELWSIENVIGTAYDDVIGGSDQASGTLSGHEGNDLFEIAFDDVAVAAGSSATTVLGGAGFDTLSFANLVPAGTTGAAVDLTNSDTGNVFSSIEYVIGSSGHDKLTMGHTSNYLEGGLGHDLLFGGVGKDTYIFNFGDGEDTITDLNGNDLNLVGGGDDDTVSFGAGIEFRHIIGELSAGTAPGFLNNFPAGHFDSADLKLGIRDINSSAQDYETSLSVLSNTVTVKFGGALDALTVGVHEIEAGAGLVERLQFTDSGHIDMTGVHTFMTGSINADTIAASSASGGAWMFSGAGDDLLSGSAQDDVLVGGDGLDLTSGGEGNDQYAYWLGDGHDILDDAGGLDTLVFGGGIRIDDLTFRKGVLSDPADPSSFIDAASGENGADLRVEIIDPADETTVLGSVTIRNYRDKDQMIERIRASALDKAIDVLKELDPVQFADIDSAVQLQYSSSIDISLSELLGEAITSENADHVTAAEGQSALYGYGGDDTLRAGKTDDVLAGGPGADELHGGFGIDFASYENAAAGVVVDLSLDKQAQRDGGDFEEEGDRLRDIEGVIGSSHGDTIKGNIFENILIGGAGNDHLTGDSDPSGPVFSAAGDTFVFDGEHGSDIIYDFEVGRDVLEFQNIDRSTIALSISGANTTLTHSQGAVQLINVQWTALPHDNSITVDGSALADYGNIIMQQGAGAVSHDLAALPGSAAQAYSFALEENAENGTVTVTDHGDGTYSYSYETTSGTFSGSDSFAVKITGADGAEQIGLVNVEVQPSSQLRATKTLYGSLGHDELTGGLGYDYIYGDTVGSTNAYDLIGGNDTLSGDNGSGQLYGDGYNLYAASVGGNDVLKGGNRTDYLRADAYQMLDTSRGGDDVLEAGAGADYLYGDADNLYHDTSGGDDVLNGGDGNDYLYGDGVNMSSNAAGGDDDLKGGAGNDFLYGDAYSMANSTAAGDDRLEGGAGNDHLYGDGASLATTITRGVDTFVFNGAHGSDIIYDFEVGRDVLEFQNIDGSTLSLSLRGANTILTHSQGTVQVNGVQWMNLDDVPYSVGAGSALPSDLSVSLLIVPELYSGALIGTVLADGEPVSDISNMEVFENGVTSTRFEIAEIHGAAILKVIEGVSLDFESEVSNSVVGLVDIAIRAHGAGGTFYEEVFVVSIADLNDAPTTISLSSDTVDEHSPGAVVGDLIITDQDIGDSHSIAIQSPDTSQFEVFSASANSFQLKLKDNIEIDWEELPDGSKSIPVTLTATDVAGSQIRQTLMVSINKIQKPAPITADYSSSGTSIIIDLGANTVVGGDGRYDDLSMSINVIGTAHDDTLKGTASNNIIWGRNGNDILYGKAGDDQLFGDAGNDTLLGGTGADVIDGGDGRDRAQFHGSEAGIIVNLLTGVVSGGEAEGDTLISIERVYGSIHADHITGDDGNNDLWGNHGDDQLFGGDGNDLLLGMGGGDHLDGGEGTDRAQYNHSTAGVIVDLQNTSDNTGFAEGDTYVSIEDLYGSNFADSLRGDAGDNTIWGADGNDALFGRGGNDRLFGGKGDDHISGGDGNDTFWFDNEFGTDRVEDFEVLNPAEKIDLSAVSEISGFDDLMSNHLTAQNGNAVITAGNNKIILEGVLLSELDNSNFAF